MKKHFKYTLLSLVCSLFLISCDGDDSFFGEEIFNDETNFPFVSIFDLNEDLEDIQGNNFWDFMLTEEVGGNQVRIRYDSQDTNIISHTIFVGFESDSDAPLDTDEALTELSVFPVDLVITKEDVAAALNVPVTDLETGSVFFRGRSIDEDGNVVSDPNVFEDFLSFERHAYFYEWDFGQ